MGHRSPRLILARKVKINWSAGKETCLQAGDRRHNPRRACKPKEDWVWLAVGHASGKPKLV